MIFSKLLAKSEGKAEGGRENSGNWVCMSYKRTMQIWASVKDKSGNINQKKKVSSFWDCIFYCTGLVIHTMIFLVKIRNHRSLDYFLSHKEFCFQLVIHDKVVSMSISLSWVWISFRLTVDLLQSRKWLLDTNWVLESLITRQKMTANNAGLRFEVIKYMRSEILLNKISARE